MKLVYDNDERWCVIETPWRGDKRNLCLDAANVTLFEDESAAEAHANHVANDGITYGVICQVVLCEHAE